MNAKGKGVSMKTLFLLVTFSTGLSLQCNQNTLKGRKKRDSGIQNFAPSRIALIVNPGIARSVAAEVCGLPLQCELVHGIFDLCGNRAPSPPVQ